MTPTGAASKTRREIESQPECWKRAVELSPLASHALPPTGARVGAVGCGSAYNIAHAYARLRERAGLGETDAFVSSEAPRRRRYDHMVFFSRTGTTSETLDALRHAPPGVPTTAVTAEGESPIATEAQRCVVLDFANEQSIVETRFVTSSLAFLRVHLGEDPAPIVAAAYEGLETELPPGAPEARPIVFLGSSWAFALANEAELKLRETAQVWTESYEAMEYRHGPISLAGPGVLVWSFGTPPRHLANEVSATGAQWEHTPLDPLAELVRAQRLALELATALGKDPDHPRNLNRSVILDVDELKDES
ncbi:MAG TPA: hypothetical protein VKR27_07910 [Acidimicrobiales bacterium]|nr:hypothetical protein [Acidimicrobiales bacterium]